MLRTPWAEIYRMGGMTKGINCLRLRFSDFVTIYAFYILALGGITLNLETYSRKSTANSSCSMIHQSAIEAELGEELRQTKELVQ
jgi:hypothetical protein